MVNPAPTTRNYRPYTSTGTKTRSIEKEEERQLLAQAFAGIEAGNFEDNSVSTRLIIDKNVTLPKLSDEIVSLILAGDRIAIARRQEFIANPGQQIFDLEFDYAIGLKELLWFKNGELQKLGTAGTGSYIEFSDHQIETNDPAVGGELFTALKLGVSGATPAAQEVYYATAGQTVFSLGFNYVQGSNELLVFRNGVKQVAGTKYNETSNDSVTFTFPLSEGDEVEFIVYEAANSNYDYYARKFADIALQESLFNWLRSDGMYTDMFFDTSFGAHKQHSSGDAEYYYTQEFGGNGKTYIAKCDLTCICGKAKLLWKYNGLGSITINVSTDDGVSLTPVLVSDTMVELSGTTGNKFHVQVQFTGDAKLSYIAAKLSPNI